MFFYTKGTRKEEMVCYLHFGTGRCGTMMNMKGLINGCV